MRALIAGGTLALALAAVPAFGDRYWGTVWDDDTVRSWSCGSDGFYGIKIPEAKNSQGGYQPFAEKSGARFSIQLKKENDASGNWVLKPPFYFYITYQQQPTPPVDYGEGIFNCCLQSSSMLQTLRYGSSKVDKADSYTAQIDGNYKNITLVLTKDDADWRFVVSKTDLETEREARHSKVVLPPDMAAPKAEAEVSFMTGVCVEDEHPNNWKPERK